MTNRYHNSAPDGNTWVPIGVLVKRIIDKKKPTK